MEIEAKFSVPNPAVYFQLQAANRLAGYSLSTVQVKDIRDTYLDTRQRLILAAGYSCRRRESRQGIVMTLKSLDKTTGAVHRRGEWEIKLAVNQPPAKWPDSPVRDRVLQLIGKDPILPLFDLQQTRVIRLMKQNEQPVAELSLDSVSLSVKDQVHSYFELEVELLPQMPEEMLSPVIACLQDEWKLKPEPLSKFERALTVVDAALREKSGFR